MATIVKQKLTLQDMALGRGKVLQNRQGRVYSLDRIDLPIVVESLEDLADADITATARIYTSPSTYSDFVYDSSLTGGVQSNLGNGSWYLLRNITTGAIQTRLASDYNSGEYLGDISNFDELKLVVSSDLGATYDSFKGLTVGISLADLEAGATLFKLADVNGTNIVSLELQPGNAQDAALYFNGPFVVNQVIGVRY